MDVPSIEHRMFGENSKEETSCGMGLGSVFYFALLFGRRSVCILR